MHCIKETSSYMLGNTALESHCSMVQSIWTGHCHRVSARVQGSQTFSLTPLEDLVRLSSVLQKRKRNPKGWYF